MEKAVIYARVSVKGEDISNQIRTIRDWAGKGKYLIVGEFKDEEVTGTLNPFKREAFKSLLKYCKDNDVKTILIHDLSRLGRSLPEAATVIKELSDQGFKIIFTKFNLEADVNTIHGKAVIYSLLMAAEFERDFMRMRLESARAAGKHVGHPFKKLPLSEKQLLQYYKKGVSIRSLAKICGVSPSTISRRIKKLKEKRKLNL